MEKCTVELSPSVRSALVECVNGLIKERDDMLAFMEKEHEDSPCFKGRILNEKAELCRFKEMLGC